MHAVRGTGEVLGIPEVSESRWRNWRQLPMIHQANSHPMSNGKRRPHIEAALTLDIRRLKSEGMLHDGTCGHIRWIDGGNFHELASLKFAIAIDGETGTLTLNCNVAKHNGLQHETNVIAIALSSIPLHFGGRRWYLHCPVSNRRAQTLHMWPGIDLFCHRTAISPAPTYASQRVSGLGRTIMQFEVLRRRMPKLQRRRRMKMAEMERYLAKAADLSRKQHDGLRRMLVHCGMADELDQWI